MIVLIGLGAWALKLTSNAETAECAKRSWKKASSQHQTTSADRRTSYTKNWSFVLITIDLISIHFSILREYLIVLPQRTDQAASDRTSLSSCSPKGDDSCQLPLSEERDQKRCVRNQHHYRCRRPRRREMEPLWHFYFSLSDANSVCGMRIECSNITSLCSSFGHLSWKLLIHLSENMIYDLHQERSRRV